MNKTVKVFDGETFTINFERAGPDHAPLWRGSTVSTAGEEFIASGSTKQQVINILQLRIRNLRESQRIEKLLSNQHKCFPNDRDSGLSSTGSGTFSNSNFTSNEAPSSKSAPVFTQTFNSQDYRKVHDDQLQQARSYQFPNFTEIQPSREQDNTSEREIIDAFTRAINQKEKEYEEKISSLQSKTMGSSPTLSEERRSTATSGSNREDQQETEGERKLKAQNEALRILLAQMICKNEDLISRLENQHSNIETLLSAIAKLRQRVFELEKKL